jgi:membrane-associated phospholipid phosphatase
VRAVDRLLLGYVGFTTVIVGWRLAAGAGDGALAWLLLMHVLLGALVLLLARVPPGARTGSWLHDLYPLLLLGPFYAEIGLLNQQVPYQSILRHDAVIQGWEAAWFGGQPSYNWIRDAPSAFWSGVLHLAYFAFYPIIILGPVLVALHRPRPAAARVILGTMTAFVPCYVAFILYPVAGPYYAFPQPTGTVRDIWSAELVYGVLARGSSVGAAFPSSHVAATVATTLGMLSASPKLGWWFVPPTVLLTVGTVYCQMHYAVDALSGMMVGAAAWMGARAVSGRQ